MKLFAAGFNAWNQLQFQPQAQGGAAAPGGQDLDPEDVAAFACVLEDDKITNLQPHLTYTAVTTSKGRLLAGMPPAAVAAETVDAAYAENLKGHVVVHDDKGRVLQYPTLSDYITSRLEGLSGQKPRCTVLDIPSATRIVQVVAYDAGFAALAADSRVFTWGDPRFPECQGRDGPLSDDPAPIPFFDDLPTGPVVTLAAGGYVLAARTRGDDLYCWGGYAGRATRVLPDLTGDPTPIIVGVGGSHDGLDIAAVGVGEEHMIVLATDGSVCVRGSNANGQLGLGGEQGLAGDWRRVDNLGLGAGERVVGVAAGPRSSFILVSDADEEY